MKISCEYCPEQIDTRGMAAHVHFRHRGEVLSRFRNNPVVGAALICGEIAMAIAGAGPKALPAVPADLERALMYVEYEEDRLAADLELRGVTVEHVQAGSVPSDLVSRMRQLMRARYEIAGFPVWEAPVFERQCEHAQTVIGYAYVERCPVCQQRNPYVLDFPITDEAVAPILPIR